MEDWFHSILEYLYKNHRLDDTDIDITSFLLTELKISATDVNKAGQLRNVFNYLKSKGFIDWGYSPTTEGALSFGAPHTLQNHESIDTTTLKHHKVLMKLTLDGYNYYTERERLKQQHDSIITTNDSVRGTNTKTWIIASVAALFAMLTFFKDCKRDNQQDHKFQQLQDTLTKQLQDSSQQIRETVVTSVHRLQYQIDTSLRKSSLKDTDALRHSPIDKKNN